MAVVPASLTSGRHRPESDADRIKHIVAELGKRLEIDEDVRVAIVPGNDRIVSVEPVGSRRAAFHMLFEAAFLARLDEEDLRAVVAHELGHVWIFTHHPYLHTEALANQIALRVVSSNSLKRVYEKLSMHRGATRQSENSSC